jgi:myosin-7
VQRNIKVKGLKLGGSNRLDYRDCFQIKHFAGTVMYTVKEWVPKSMDALLPHLAEVMLNSTESYIQELFDQEVATKMTVGEKFVKQLEGLAHTLEEGETLFVRCIKSNPQKQPGAVNRPLVLEQLLFGGVISALEMRHRGMPERMDYEDFCDKFESIEEPKNRKRDYRVRTELLLRDVFGLEAEAQHEYAFGYTKVFMQSAVFSFLRSLDALRFKHLAMKVQHRWLVYLGVMRIRKVEKAGRALKAAQEKAAVDRVEKLPGFVKLMAAAKAKIGPAERALADARRKHGQDAQKISAA